jgi:Flp pilus assembly protein CpaB
VKQRSNRLVILVGVLLAVLAFVGVLFLLQQGGTAPEEETPMATVLVAKVDIAIGDEVTPDMVEVTEVDPGAVSGTPLTDPSQLSPSRASLYDIPAGGQVNQQALGIAPGTDVCISCSLLEGEKAIAFQVDRVTGLDFLILPGDRIDVVLNQRIPVVQPTVETVNSPPEEQRFEAVPGLEAAVTVKTVLQNKRVLYVSQARNVPGAEPTPAPDGGEEPAPEITSVIIIFAGTDQDAELIKLAQNDVSQTGALTAVLRHAQDDVAEATTGVTLSLLIERYGVPVPNIVLLQTE